MASGIPTHMLNPLEIEVLDLEFINFKYNKPSALVIGGLLVGNKNISCTDIFTFIRFLELLICSKYIKYVIK